MLNLNIFIFSKMDLNEVISDLFQFHSYFKLLGILSCDINKEEFLFTFITLQKLIDKLYKIFYNFFSRSSDTDFTFLQKIYSRLIRKIQHRN